MEVEKIITNRVKNDIWRKGRKNIKINSPGSPQVWGS